MSSTVSRLAIALGMDNSGLQGGAKQAESILSNLQSRVMSMGGAISAALGGLSLGGFVGMGVKMAAEAEVARAAFATLLGDVAKGERMFDELRKFAAETPFEMPELQAAARTMLAFGVAGDQVIPSIKMLGDIAGGNGDKLRLLALAFSQVAAAGKLTGQDLIQLVNAGFSPLQEISRKTGMGMAELKEEMSKGNISFEMVVEAFRSATGEGGRFNGLLEKMSDTLSGRWARLVASVKELATQAGERLMPTLKKVVGVGLETIDWLKGLDETTVRNTANVAAFTFAFGAAIAIVPKIIGGVMMIVKAFRSLATAQAIQQALSGPRGWATLAVGLGIAAGAAFTVNSMFGEQETQLAEVTKAATENAQATNDLASAQELLADTGDDAAKALEKLRDRGAAITESVRTPVEIAADKMSELNQLVMAGTISSETYGRAWKKVQEELFQATEQAQKFKDVSRIEVGAVSRNSMAGFSAVMRSQLENNKQLEIQKQELEVAKRQTALLEEANRLSKERGQVKQVNL